jgi:2,3-diketo-5-methylthio-1-phosphopentane phosphatase
VHIYCDFDGTITAQDTTDTVLRELAHPEWESLEAAWVAGQISAAECMRKQIALIQGDDAALEAVLDKIDLRTGFAAFARWCKEEDLPLIVVSDGVDFMIRHVLNRHGLGYLPIFANQLAGAPGARLLDQPWSASACMNKSGVCKCRVTRAGVPSPLVYVGDGRSDFCIAEEADLLFARATLARHCVDHGLAFIPYDNFSDVQRYLFLVRLDGRRQTVPTTERVGNSL